VNDKELKVIADAEAATARLQKSLRAAKSMVRDYRSKLCRRNGSDTGEPNRTSAFRFER
jgi:hypothetical protein